MQNAFNTIKAFLKKQKQANFTGSIKMGIEDGLVNGITISNSFDVITSYADDTMLDDILKQIAKQGFFGSVIFVYKYGRLQAYSYIQTIKSNNLATFFKE